MMADGEKVERCGTSGEGGEQRNRREAEASGSVASSIGISY